MRRLVVVVPMLGALLVAPASAPAATAHATARPTLRAQHTARAGVDVRSDFNGDGFSDLAIGVPGEDNAYGVPRTGAVHVLYGETGGLIATGVEQFWTQGHGGLIDAEEPNDAFGEGLASGDFNDDGYDDLVIGVSGQYVNGDDYAGAIHVIYGGSTGLQASDPDDQVFTEDSAGVRGSSESGDYFGFSLAAADFNGDGYDDVAVGVAGQAVGGEIQAGAVHILYGSASGVQVSAPDDATFDQDSTDVQDAAEAIDLFAYTLDTGDFNDDGFADLSIGVPFEDLSTSDEGAVEVLYGTSGGLQASSPPDRFLTQDTAGVQDTSETGDLFGLAVAAGDFDGDAADDLAIGAPSEDDAVSDQGAVNVLYGDPAGLQTGDDDFWTQDSPDVRGQAEQGDMLGYPLVSNDFNADGKDDLVMSATEEGIGTHPGAGMINVLYGAASGLQATSPDDQIWHENSPGVKDVAQTEGTFGQGLASGDYDGDGTADLAVGTYLSDQNGIEDVGVVHVLYSTPATGIQATSPDDQRWYQDSTDVSDAAEEDDHFGFALV